MDLYKVEYPLVLGLEFAAVQIIAVDSVRNSGSHIAGYLIKAGHPIHNTVSTGDLNRGRRVRPRLLFGSFCRSKKNKPVPFRKLSDKQKVCPCRGSTLRVLWSFEVLQTSNQCAASRLFCRLRRISLLLPQQSRPLRGISPTFEKVGQNMGRRDAAPYRDSTLCVLFCSFCKSKKNKKATRFNAWRKPCR